MHYLRRYLRYCCEQDVLTIFVLGSFRVLRQRLLVVNAPLDQFFLRGYLLSQKELKLNPRAAFLKQIIGIAPAICIKGWFLIKWSPQAAFFNSRRITV